MERIIILEKEKTALVVPEKEDCKLWSKGLNNLQISQFLSVYGEVITTESSEKYLEESQKDSSTRLFSILSKKENKVIGNCGISEINFKNGRGSIGIGIFDKESLEKGHGTESVKMVLEFSFKVLGLRKIKIRVYGNNHRAIHVYEKIGFKKVGTFKEEHYKNGEFVDEILMEIFKEEWKK